MWTLIPQKQMPPTRSVRYCCAILKETGGKGRAIATGVRRDESIARRSRVFANNFSKALPAQLDFDDAASLFEDADKPIEHDDNFIRSCKMRGKTSFQPILDWLDGDVWQFIEDNGIPTNPLYESGFGRVGCIGCPFASRSQRESEFEMYPKFKAAYLRSFDKMLDHRRASGLKTEWATAEEVMKWWMSR
jgi:phosphoadenosine phosphosulfate reductase